MKSLPQYCWITIVAVRLSTHMACEASTVVPVSFITITNITTGSAPQGITMADVHRDGLQDLITVDLEGHVMSIFKGNGDGTFSAPTNYTVGGTPTIVVAHDLNADGYPDLAVLSQTQQALTVLTNKGSGTFSLANTNLVGVRPYGITIGDFNADDRPDVAVANFDG